MENKTEFTEMDPVEQFLMNGCAFIPVNVEGVGDCLSILLQNGERRSVHKTSRWFLDEVVRSFGNDLVKLRRIYGKATGRKYYVPLPLTNHLTLIPLKVRRPVGSQTAFGWFVAEQIQDIRQDDHGRTEVKLCEQHAVTVLWSVRSCEEQYRKAALAKDKWKRLHQFKPQERRRDNLFHLYTPNNHKGKLL